ncbi:MAG TPA: hypothetical protein P5556_00405 [Candidatus Gastranaerophilales bacterium]|nr:hypothetical protein [Candidatus Gastranaerophilales bacterium]
MINFNPQSANIKYQGNSFVASFSGEKMSGTPYDNFLLRKKELGGETNVGFSNNNATTPQKQINPVDYLNRTYEQARRELNKPKGKLVHGSVFSNPFTTLSQSVKTFKKALNGQGTDHSLGRLNDPAIALGTLSIAGILASAAKSPFPKAMEFVGATAWLSSMSLWPGVVLAKPTKKFTGVDLNLQYVNSQGEKKPFYLDSQYIAWDLMDKKSLEEAGEKLDVSKNMPNRDEEIQRRMTKVATGVNTWWMLSAGLSTPLMASLMADRMRAPVQKIIDSTKVLSAEAQLEAAGYNTGSNNPLVKAGKKVVKFFSGITGFVENKEKKELDGLLEKSNVEGIKTFFEKTFKDGAIAESVRQNITKEALEESLENGKLTDTAKEAIGSMFTEGKQFAKEEKLWNKYFNATLEYRWGSERQTATQKILNVLGIKGEQLKELATPGDPIRHSEIIAESIKKITQNGSISEVGLQIHKTNMEKITGVPAQRAIESGNFLLNIAGQMRKKFESSIFSDEIARSTKRLVEKTEDKVLNIKTSLNLTHFLDQGNESVDDLAKNVRKLNGNDIWNNLKKVNHGSLNGMLEKMYGKTSANIDKILHFVSAKDDFQAATSNRINSWAGESTSNMLHGAADQKYNFNQWFKKIGIYSGGTLLATTATALFLIYRNAKNGDLKKERA